MTIKNLYPPNRPASIYNVINGRPELPVSSTFSRASEGTYVDSAGIIRTAAADEPRFNHDPETGEFLGLLLDIDRQNKFLWSEALLEGKYQAYNTITDNVAIAPSGEQTAGKAIASADNRGHEIGHTVSGWPVNSIAISSVFVKPIGCDIAYMRTGGGAGGNQRVDINVRTKEVKTSLQGRNYGAGAIEYPNGWWRLWSAINTADGDKVVSCVAGIAPPGSALDIYNVYEYAGDGTLGVYAWGYQQELSPAWVKRSTRPPSAYIKTEASAVTALADEFSLTTTNSFDAGFSLLLDSETLTEDFIYKINAGGTEVASLNNDNGTLDWNVNGSSAKINGDYPQVGFVNGRVRTISSFTAAGDAVNPNYLYTKGLSFPTVGAPASGADELEFGVPQTLKAVYVWSGQLDPIQAVSIIKGDTNIVPNIPIVANKYSFVYNTDPKDTGNTLITLPYIVPTAVSGGMTIDWGDGSPIRPYNKGVVPSHDYPYPGQYRIQISGNETWSPAGDITGTLTGGGFDRVRLGGSPTPDNSITQVDQWAPQHRVGASGPGFTGDDMKNLLITQNCEHIPDYKYTDLTELNGAFYGNSSLRIKGPNNAKAWSWVPTELQSATGLNSTFSTTSPYSDDHPTYRDQFPQLKTSDKLVEASSALQNTYLRGFKTDGDVTTYQPFTDTSKVVNFDFCFMRLKTPTIVVDTQSATSMLKTFYGMDQITGDFPFIQTGKVINFEGTFESCTGFTGFPLIDTKSGESFKGTWSDCSALTSFPLINTSNGTNFTSAWNSCTALETFPDLDVKKGTNFYSAWEGCQSLEVFPLLEMPEAGTLSRAWQGSGIKDFPEILFPKAGTLNQAWYNSSIETFPLIEFPEVTDANVAWQTCRQLGEFPAINFPKCRTFAQTWRQCSKLTKFPSIDVSAGTNFGYAWNLCTKLADFPAGMFDTTGTLSSDAFNFAWTDCALTAQSIENILVSLDTNGASNIKLGIDDGTNAAKSTWTAAAVTAFNNLAGDPAVPGDTGKGWTISFNA